MPCGSSIFSASTGASSRRRATTAQAAAAARYGVITSLIADVVRAYVDLRGLQVRAGILRSAGDVLRESLRIVNIRYERGITNELDVQLATRELDTLEAQIAPLDAEVNAGEYTLAVLLGEYPENMVQELSAATLIPSMPAPVAPGAPLDLLKRRPDIQQAERELAAATARIGVATANLFPQVALVGAIGSQARIGAPCRTFRKHIWSFGPAALWPLLDFGALDAEVNIAHLEAHAQLGELPQDDFERGSAGGYRSRWISGAAGPPEILGRCHGGRAARGRFGDRPLQPRPDRLPQRRRCGAPILRSAGAVRRGSSHAGRAVR